MPDHDGMQLFIEDFRDLASLDLTQLRAALAFSVELIPRIGGEGKMLRLADASLGAAIDFPWWDDPEQDLGEWELGDIPLGTIEEPYSGHGSMLANSDVGGEWRGPCRVWRCRRGRPV